MVAPGPDFALVGTVSPNDQADLQAESQGFESPRLHALKGPGQGPFPRLGFGLIPAGESTSQVPAHCGRVTGTTVSR